MVLTRRSALFASAVFPGGVVPALAQRHVSVQRPAMPTTGDLATGGRAETPLGPVDTAASWAFIMDFATGSPLLEKNADAEIPPSSMAKLMTIYLVCERLKQGRMKLDDELLVSERASRMRGSRMFVQLGSLVKVEDLIRGVIVQSGNDACIVFAEAISGSEEQFAGLMNQKAKEIGLTNSYFKNATGWPDPEQHMSCRDIAILAGCVIRDFPEYYHYESEKAFKYNKIEQGNRNPLVQKGVADGLKTGHTEAGGYGLCASARRGGRRVIVVLNGMDSMHRRAMEGERLMDWAFANFEDVKLFAAGNVVARARVWLGASLTVPLVGERDLIMTMPRNWRKNASIKITYDSPVHAPVMKGTALGKLVVSGEGIPKMEAPLIAGMDVPKLGLPSRAVAMILDYLIGR